MKKLVFWVSLLIAGFLQAQRVQIIHNSPDPMLRTVDIWVNGGEQPILDDFPFRGATPFIDIGSLGITGNITIEIKPKNSNAQTPALLTKQIFLNSNDVKYIIANGLINTAAYANPFGYNLSADLLLVDALIESNSNDTYSLRLFHGVSDVSPVSIFLNNNLQPSVPLLTYGRASSYINMAAEVSNSIAIRIPGQNATIAQLEINSRGKGGKTGILLGSGFAFPANNNNGPFLAFFLVNPDGSTEVVNIETATVEILNNVSDPTAPGLFFGIKNLNLNIETPTSTIGYLQAYQTGVGVNNTWQIIAYDAQGNVRAVSSPFLAQRGGRYRFVLNGVVNLSNYDLSVNGTAIHVSFFEWGGSNLSNPNLGNVAFRVLHASPDAPAVNVSVRQLGVTPIKNLSYRQATEVIQLPADYYIFDISPSGVPNLVLSYAIDFNEYTNKRGIIFASGYLEPSRNQNGAEFGIYFWPEGATRATPLESIPLSWCDTPVDIRVQSSSPNSARVIWAPMPSAVLYRVTFAKASEWENKKTVIYTENNYFEFFDSLPNQEWKITINTICEDGNSSLPSEPLLVQAQRVNCNTLNYDFYVASASCDVCRDGSISMVPYGGIPPYQFSIDGITFQNRNVFTALTPATYSVTLKDAVGCLAIKQIMVDNSVCSAPRNLGTVFIGRNTAQLTWEVVPGAYQYEIKYWPQGATTPTVRYRSTPGFYINFLTPGTTYNVEVKAFCAGISSSASFLQFRTTAGKEGITSLEENNFLEIYPNPTRNLLNFIYKPLQENEGVQLRVIDLQGQILVQEFLNTITNEEINHSLNISNLPAGFYFLEIVDGESRNIAKFQVN